MINGGAAARRRLKSNHKHYKSLILMWEFPWSITQGKCATFAPDRHTGPWNDWPSSKMYGRQLEVGANDRLMDKIIFHPLKLVNWSINGWKVSVPININEIGRVFRI